MEAEPHDDARIEALDAPGAGIALHLLIHLPAELGIARAALELDYKRRALRGRKRLRKRGYAVLRPGEAELLELGEAHVRDAALDAAEPLYVVVVEDNKLAVRREMHVQLGAVAYARGVLKGGGGVLRRALIYAVQAAVGKVAAHEGRALLEVALPRRDEEDQRGHAPRQGPSGGQARPSPFI